MAFGVTTILLLAAMAFSANASIMSDTLDCMSRGFNGLTGDDLNAFILYKRSEVLRCLPNSERCIWTSNAVYATTFTYVEHKLIPTANTLKRLDTIGWTLKDAGVRAVFRVNSHMYPTHTRAAYIHRLDSC